MKLKFVIFRLHFIVNDRLYIALIRNNGHNPSQNEPGNKPL